MQRSTLFQDKIVHNYNNLVAAFENIGIELTKHNEQGICAGLSLNFLLFAKENRLDEFYRYLELTAALNLHSINQIIKQTLLDPKKDFKKGALEFQASFDKEKVLVSKDRFLQFLKVISDAQDEQFINTIGANWDLNDLIFCENNDFASELGRSLNEDDEGFYYVSMGLHAFAMVKRKNGFELFEPNNMNRKILKTSDELAKTILDNQNFLINNNNVAFTIFKLSYGDKNREIDDLVEEFIAIINQEKYKTIVNHFFDREKDFIDAYRKKRAISRMELRLVFSEYITEKLKIFKETMDKNKKITRPDFNLPLDEENDPIKLELFNKLSAFKSILDDHLEQNKKQIQEYLSNQEKLLKFKNKRAYIDNVSCVLLAVDANQIGTLEYLLNEGANPNIAKGNGATALYYAVTEGHLECVKLLLAHPMINLKLTKNNGHTALMDGIAKGRLECVKALLPYVDPNVDNEGVTALYTAAKCGQLACLNLLLDDPRVKIGIMPKDGITALSIAAFYGHVECVKALIPKIDPKAIDNEGNSALLFAAENGKAECIKILLPFVNPIQANHVGNNALLIAAENGHAECVKILIPHIHPDRVNNFGVTPLYAAVQKGHLACVKVLLEHNADTNLSFAANVNILLSEADKKGRKSDLEKLLKINNTSFINSLWSKETSPKKEKLEGFNALHAAVLFGRLDIIKLLLENGADTNCKAEGLSALDFAKAMKHTRIITLLEKASIENTKINRIVDFFAKHIGFFAEPFDEKRHQLWTEKKGMTERDFQLIECQSEIMHALDENQKISFTENKNEYKKIIGELFDNIKNKNEDRVMLFKFLKKNPALVETMLKMMTNPANDNVFTNILKQ